jgi:hypothetical protein
MTQKAAQVTEAPAPSEKSICSMTTFSDPLKGNPQEMKL